MTFAGFRPGSPEADRAGQEAVARRHALERQKRREETTIDSRGKTLDAHSRERSNLQTSIQSLTKAVGEKRAALTAAREKVRQAKISKLRTELGADSGYEGSRELETPVPTDWEIKEMQRLIVQDEGVLLKFRQQLARLS